MRKISNIWTAILCVILLLACATPVSAEKRGQTKTASLDVMLVVDDTVSMKDNDPNQIASLALQKFAERIPGEGSRIGMATYDDDILTSTCSLTGTDQPMVHVVTQKDKNNLKEYAGKKLTQGGHYTDLPGALYYAVEQIQKIQNLDPMDSIPAIIAVSDGENDFITTAAEVRSNSKLEEVLDAGIPVYLIVINNSEDEDVRDHVREYMQGIADDTGGQALFVDSGDEIDTFLMDVVNELYGLDPDDNILIADIGQEPKDWAFSLEKGIFEANLELTHESKLNIDLFGPDGTPIPLEGTGRALKSEIPNRDGLKTTIRLIEPDEGNYVMRLSSAHVTQHVIGEIILNNEIYVQVDLSPSTAKKGDTVEVTAKLMRGGKLYTSLAFANLEASVSVDGGQSKEMQRDDNENVFRYSLTVPDQKNDPQVVVTVQGQKSFLRSSDPVTLEIERSSGIPNRNHGSNDSNNDSDNDSLPILGIILLAVLLIIIILIVGLILRGRGPGGKNKYIRLQGTLTVTYFDDAHQYIWEKFVCPGTYFSKRSPRESLGKMLRDQQGYEDIPNYFDMIQIAGLQSGDGKLCVEVTGEFNTPSGPEKINRRIDINNGRTMDEMGDMGFFDSISSANLVFPDGTQTELKFSL